MPWKRAAAIALAAALGACAELTADAPLFTAADQAGAPPLVEGIWIGVSEQCPERHARSHGRFPKECTPLEIRRAEDAAWRVVLRADLAYGLTAEEREDADNDRGPYRVVIVPAVERALEADAFAPLYVAEIAPADEGDDIGYAVLAPIGAMPATSAILVASIGCHDILRDGPIAGIEAEYAIPEEPLGTPSEDTVPSPPPTLSGCVASTQAAVREAARRALIENLGGAEVRLVYVRPR